jgi:hypothetical protein
MALPPVHIGPVLSESGMTLAASTRAPVQRAPAATATVTATATGQQASPRYTPARARLPAVQAALGYLSPTGERPYNYAYEPPAGAAWENYRVDERAVWIRDARALDPQPCVDCEGFALWDAPSSVTDFADGQAVTERYYPEVAELACAATGAARAYVFDHLVRRRDAQGGPLGFGRPGKGQPAGANGRVHNDYTEASGRRRLKLVLGEAAAVGAGHYAIVNVWRPLRGPVLDTPLALCDARSVDAVDLVGADVRYPHRTGDIYLMVHSPRHRWFYVSGMDRHEALVFKQYDSRISGVARFTPHAAFDHPDAPPAAPPRVSIEARCLVLFH